MTNVTQAIHGAIDMTAVRYDPTNANAVTMEVKTEDGFFTQTLFFGHTIEGKSRANALYFALGGDIKYVVGSKAHAEWVSENEAIFAAATKSLQ